MPSYKLVYFNAKARAEPVRYMFAIAGVKYEDQRDFEFTGPEWPKLKPSITLGQLPVLYVDGKELPQSRAINRYVARQHGLYGSNSWECAQVDVVCETMDEIWPHIVKIVREQDATKKGEFSKALATEESPKLCAKIEKLLKQNKGGEGWFVGDKVSLADAVVYSILADIVPAVTQCPDVVSQESLKKFLKRFQSHPKVAKWIKNRPSTPV